MSSDVDYLYDKRKKVVQGLISVEFVIESELRSLSIYVHHSEDPLVVGEFDSFEVVGKNYKQSISSQYLHTWTEKLLHQQFLQDISLQQ